MCWWNFYFLLYNFEFGWKFLLLFVNLKFKVVEYKDICKPVVWLCMWFYIYQIQGRVTQYVVWPIELQCCPMMVKMVWQSMSKHILYPPPLRFLHFLILYFNSFFYLVEDSYFSLFICFIISSLGWSFLIRIRYCLKYKVFWLNFYVSIQLLPFFF